MAHTRHSDKMRREHLVSLSRQAVAILKTFRSSQELKTLSSRHSTANQHLDSFLNVTLFFDRYLDRLCKFRFDYIRDFSLNLTEQTTGTPPFVYSRLLIRRYFTVAANN